MEFFPSSRHQPAASLRPGNPLPNQHTVRSVSHALDGFAPPPALRVCFTPQPRPGFALQGFVPLRGAVPGFPGLVMPSCRWTSPPAELPPRQRTRPRLQGLAPRGECGVVRSRLKPRPIRAPHGLPLPPPGTHSLHRRDAFAPPPPTTFFRDEPTAAGPRRFAGARFGLPGTRPPTRTRFPT